MSKRIPHCWEDGPRTEDGCSTTCMLLYGHTGPHRWTRDDQIGVRFEPAAGSDSETNPESQEDG